MRELLSDVDTWEVCDPDHALVLVGCSGTKAELPAPARDFYRGELFRVSVRWAESWDFRWRVHSALHDLVAPDEMVSPYDMRLRRGMSDEGRMTMLREQLPADITSLIALSGRIYVEEAQEAWPDLQVWTPLQELPARGLGHYKRWLIRNTKKSRKRWPSQSNGCLRAQAALRRGVTKDHSCPGEWPMPGHPDEIVYCVCECHQPLIGAA